jgi:uncharacterized protein YutE (UPF0331/DUF86 family)
MNQRILVKLDELEQVLTELRNTLPSNYSDYHESRIIQRAVERLIQIAVESVVDICAILVKDLRLGVPRSEEDYFTKLETIVFEPALVKKLHAMRRFRNRVVHRYGDLDDQQVYQIVEQSFHDFDEFADTLRMFLKKSV